MKIIIATILAVSAWLFAGCHTTPANPYKLTYSSFDLPAEHPPKDLIAAGTMNFQGVSLENILKIYQALSGRTVIRGPLPDVKITLRTQTPLNCVQTLQLFDTVLAQNGIAMVLAGENAVKAVTVSQATSESPPEISRPWQQLPESSSFMMRTVAVKKLKPSTVVPMLAPLSKLPNSIVAIDSEKLLILRDYSAAIRQELQLLEKLEQNQKP